MSQYYPNYNSPYQPPQPSYPPPYGMGNPAASRAGILTIVIGSLTIVFAALLGVAAADLVQELSKMELPGQGRVEPEMLKSGVHCLAVGLGLAGVALVILGVFVRRGSRGAIITNIVMSGLGGLMMLCNVFNVMRMGGAQAAVGACLPVVILGVLVWNVIWLLAALNGPPPQGPWGPYGQYYPPYGQGYPGQWPGQWPGQPQGGAPNPYQQYPYPPDPSQQNPPSQNQQPPGPQP